MSKANLLILAEQSKVFTPYKLILNSYFNEIETLLIDNNLFLANRQLKKFHLILIDLSTKKFIENLDDFLRLYIKNSKFIFIIPFEISHISSLIKEDANLLNLVLTKPIDMTKLEQFVKVETIKIEKKNILEKKNHVLAKVVDLHPSKIAVYTLDGVLFYANSNYLISNNLKLKDIDNLEFDIVNKGIYDFKTIKEKLKISLSFVTQREENSRWFESVFYIILMNL